MMGVKVKDRESLESALRRFKEKCERSGILSDIRKHQHFEVIAEVTPGVERPDDPYDTMA